MAKTPHKNNIFPSIFSWWIELQQWIIFLFFNPIWLAVERKLKRERRKKTKVFFCMRSRSQKKLENGEELWAVAWRRNEETFFFFFGFLRLKDFECARVENEKSFEILFDEDWISPCKIKFLNLLINMRIRLGTCQGHVVLGRKIC